jgi:ribosomal protein S19
MSRSIWKGPFNQNIDKQKKNLLLKEPEVLSRFAKIAKDRRKENIPFLQRNIENVYREKKRVWSRGSMILPQYVGRSFFVYNGKTFISISISPKMLGHKFGEFASTRKKPFHKKKK